MMVLRNVFLLSIGYGILWSYLFACTIADGLMDRKLMIEDT